MTDKKTAVLFAVLAVAVPVAAQDAKGRTTVGVGFDYAEGRYGTPDKTTSVSLPVSIKHERGPWTLRASLPYVWTEGTFSRETGVDLSGNGDPEDGPAPGTVVVKQKQSGPGDLTLGASYNFLETRDGLYLDAGFKAKIATADKADTLITSGENDYSLQLDAFRQLGRTAAVFATLGLTKKGDSATIDYRDPIYGTLGGSLNFGAAGTLGAAWDFREKTAAGGDPVSEVSLFYSFRLDAERRLQVYVVGGLSDGSPDSVVGAVLSQRF